MKHLLTLTAILFLFGCKKEVITFTISGKVNDNSFNQGHSGATVRLFERIAGNLTWEPVTSMTSDNNGEYSFTFERKQAESYLIRIEKENYFPVEEIIYFSELSVEDNNVRNFETYANSWVKLKFTNTDPEHNIVITQQEGIKGCDGCFPEAQLQFFGPVDTTLVYSTHGNTLFKYLYQVTGTIDLGIKEAQTIPFDTVAISLDY